MKNLMTYCFFYPILMMLFSGNQVKEDHGVRMETPLQDEFILHEKVTEIPGLKMGPFIRLENGDILTVTVDDTQSLISSDEGKTWQEYEIFNQPEKYKISDERALLKTKNGTIILAFMNLAARRNWNWNKEISDSPGAILPTCTVRSLDGGKTWQNFQTLHTEHTGAIRDMIETKNGNVIFPSMMMRHNPGHHTVLSYTSRNEGETWERSNIIDLGGIGHHSGVTEGTMEQMADLSIKMLMRTNWGTFWQATSVNEGITWTDIKPTSIEASSAPGLMKRLASGRLVLVYNQRFPEGTECFPLSGGDNQWSEVRTSNHRQELSISFSEDDGNTWSSPEVIAKVAGDTRQVSYPYVFEAKPGELWITTMFSDLRIRLRESDFMGQ
ncbi:MAG: exo-alpha-sialidase [Saprospiraceae bacterium]|nr:exo-alpha-sialidase [Saprospiraceae bacterium]